MSVGMLQDFQAIYGIGEESAFATIKAVCAILDLDRTIPRDSANSLIPTHNNTINPYTDSSRLTFQQNASLGWDGAPDDDWWSYLTMEHGNTNGYYTQLASNFHSDNLYWRRKAAGIIYPWHKVAFTDGKIANASFADGATYANQLHVPGVIMWEGADVYNTMNDKISRGGDTMSGALNVPTPTLP
jgi:hypothetical protein